MQEPDIQPGQDGSDLIFQESFIENFDGDGPFLNNAQFRIERMTGNNGAQHRVGNFGQDRNGIIGPNLFVDGKRWAGWYDDHQDITMRRVNSVLRMRGLSESLPDPTRTDYTDQGIFIPASTNRLTTGWLDTFARVFDNNEMRQVPDTSAPNRTWAPGAYYEIKVNFENQSWPSHRHSFWLMPATTLDFEIGPIGGGTEFVNAYDADPSSGVEVDIYEKEGNVGAQSDILLMKVIGGAAGSTPDDQITSPGINTGDHTIGCLHMPDRLVWYIDGIEVQRDEQRVPQVRMYMLVTRELNTGVGANPPPVEPKRPTDFGLWGHNAYASRDQHSSDFVDIHYVRVWTVEGVAPDNGSSGGTGTTVSNEVYTPRIAGPSIVTSGGIYAWHVENPVPNQTYDWTTSGALLAPLNGTDKSILRARCDETDESIRNVTVTVETTEP